MGEAKRRQQQLGAEYGRPKRQLFGFELNEAFKAKLIKWTIEGAIVSSVIFVVMWVMLPRLGLG
ncbi:MAG: DUF2839 family protein [Spirulina sp. SIO3F2]|nr:DUF2839 family protein [Spirulina sp. SIO3F2]